MNRFVNLKRNYILFCCSKNLNLLYLHINCCMQQQVGVVHKLSLQDKVGRWSTNVHFLSTFIPQKMSTQGGRWSKNPKILSTQYVNDPFAGNLQILTVLTDSIPNWQFLLFVNQKRRPSQCTYPSLFDKQLCKPFFPLA